MIKEHLKNKVWTIENFLTYEECQKHIIEIQNKEDKICFTDSGKFENDKYVDTELTDKFYNRFTELFEGNTTIIDHNDLIMSAKYLPNNSFNLHTDTGLYFNPIDREKSSHTLLIYLNDNFEGGETTFYSDEFKRLFSIKPKKGMALLFDINLWHTGEILKTGEKYWIGCEFISKF